MIHNLNDAVGSIIDDYVWLYKQYIVNYTVHCSVAVHLEPSLIYNWRQNLGKIYCLMS